MTLWTFRTMAAQPGRRPLPPAAARSPPPPTASATAPTTRRRRWASSRPALLRRLPRLRVLRPPVGDPGRARRASALGTLAGGWRIVKTMGMRITKLRPIGGFCAETAGAVTLVGTALGGIPVSTTHTITGGDHGRRRHPAALRGALGRGRHASSGPGSSPSRSPASSRPRSGAAANLILRAG